MNKLLLVDGSALLHRAYHAYPPLRSKSGEIVGAVYGVASMLVTSLKEQKPSHVVVAWDLPQPTFRHKLYIGYKAQREKADEEMVEQIPKVKTMIKAMGLLQLEKVGYEADDIIGSLADKFGHDKESEVLILTGDQDLMQLIAERVAILLPPRGKVPAKLYGFEEVEEKYGVGVEQFVDYKALVGDPSDNIPGVRGIGPKGASKLLSRYANLDEIYVHLDEIEVRVRGKLSENKESAYLSRELSEIKCDLELDLDWEKMEFGSLRREVLKEELEKLNFKSLVRRIWGDEKKSKIDERQGSLF